MWQGKYGTFGREIFGAKVGKFLFMHDELRFSLTIGQDIELRLFVESDAEALYKLIDTNRTHLRQWLPWVDYETSAWDTQKFIQKVRQQYANSEGFQLGIWYQGQLAGVIGYHPINWPGRHVEIGYWLGAGFEGQGIMTRACHTLVNYAFEHLTLNRVEILCATGNLRSRAIPQRLGFTLEGVMRDGEWLYDHFVDLAIYSVLAREWKINGA